MRVRAGFCLSTVFSRMIERSRIVRIAFVVVSSVCRRRPVRRDREYLLTRPSTIVDAPTTQVTRILDILSSLQVPARTPFTRPLENKFYRMSRFTLLYRVLHQ